MSSAFAGLPERTVLIIYVFVSESFAHAPPAPPALCVSNLFSGCALPDALIPVAESLARGKHSLRPADLVLVLCRLAHLADTGIACSQLKYKGKEEASRTHLVHHSMSDQVAVDHRHCCL